MAIQNKTVRISEESHKKLSENFGQFSTACQLILEPFDRLRAVTMAEMKGYFTENEIISLIDSQNATMLMPDFVYNKAFLLAQLEDFETLEGGISRHEADPEILFEKIKQLSQPQVYFLLLDLHIFWNTGQQLTDYIDKLK